MKQMKFRLALIAALVILGLAPNLKAKNRTQDQQRIMQLYQQAEKAKGENHYPEAIQLYEQAVTLAEKAFSLEDKITASLINNLAELYAGVGDYAKAEPLFKRSLEIREKSLGPNHPDVAQSLNNLAMLYQKMGDYAKAEPLYQRALAIYEKALGPNPPNVAASLNNLAALYYQMGDYAKSEPLYKRSLEIKEKALGPNHPDVANSLNNLAALYRDMGDYAKAEPLYKRSLEIWEKALGPNHPNVAASLNSLAALYYKMGDYAKAEPLYKRSLEIRGKALGPNHPDVAESLNNLALLYQKMGDYAKAEPLYKRSLEIWEKALGPEHPNVASSLNNLALLYQKMGDYTKAEPLYERSLEIRGKALGPNHPDVAIGLYNLAELYDDMGDYAKAEPLYKRSLEIREKALGPNHPDVALSLNNLAALYLKMKKVESALPLSQRATEITFKNIVETFPIASERQKLAMLEKNKESQDVFLSTVTALPDNLEAVKVGITTELRFKGLVLEAMIGEQEVLRRGLSQELQGNYGELQKVRQEISNLYVKGPGDNPEVYRTRMDELEARKEELEARLSKGSSAFKESQERFYVTSEEVCAKLSQGSALVEFVEFQNYNEKEKKEWLAAFILEEGKCAAPSMVSLGPAEAVENAIKAWREELEKFSGSGLSEEEARKRLDEKGKMVASLVWNLVAKKIALQGKSAVFISPDGPLHLMPFGALPIEGGGYLIEKVNLAYVSSGKDFLRSKKPSNRQGALLVGGVDFDLGLAPQMQVASATTGKQRGQCGKLNELMWNPLPGTAAEVNVIGSSFQKQNIPITLLKAGEAQEAKVRSAMQSARYLHFATHGFFLGDECGFAEKARDIGGVRPGMKGPEMVGPEAQGPVRKENPLLLSGLVLAGANNSWKGGAGGGDNDGYLLAMEVANMDLEGVELVTLSACKTGLGEIKRGEGVFGLKRSFMIAGAEGLVMSLWSVPDQETKELMTDFYGRILAKNPKRDSFRQSQLKLLKSGDQGGYHHPFYWAAFEYIGVN